MARRNWSKCHDCDKKINIKRNAISRHGHGCEACWLKQRKRERRAVRNG
jgi:hypothetical protein